MNEQTTNKTSPPTQPQPYDFSRWWWPVNWLRIVYGVWVDQLWYWENVRPLLRGRKQGWGIFAQGMLGAVLVALVPLAGPYPAITMNIGVKR